MNRSAKKLALMSLLILMTSTNCIWVKVAEIKVWKLVAVITIWAKVPLVPVGDDWYCGCVFDGDTGMQGCTTWYRTGPSQPWIQVPTEPVPPGNPFIQTIKDKMQLDGNYDPLTQNMTNTRTVGGWPVANPHEVRVICNAASISPDPERGIDPGDLMIMAGTSANDLAQAAGNPALLTEFQTADPITIVDCGPVVPAISNIGLIVLTLLMLTAGTVVLGRRRRPATA